MTGWTPFHDPDDRPEGWQPANTGKTYVPTLLSTDDVRAMMGAPDRGKAALRDPALIAVLYRTGILPMEAAAVTMADLDLTPGHETVRMRGGKLEPRTLALDEFAMAALRPWLDARADIPGDELFCALSTKFGEAWEVNGLRARVLTVAKRAGLADRRIHAGAFRFTLAAELMVEQWPIPYIMAQLGLQTVAAFDYIFKHLEIAPPPDTEVLEIIRERPPPWLSDAP